MRTQSAQSSVQLDDIVSRIALGDQDALKELFSHFGERVFRYALRLTQQPEVAEEVVNDVLLAVWKCAHSFRGSSKSSTWLLGITRNLSINAIRGKSIPTQDIDATPEAVDEYQEAGEQVLAAEHKQIKRRIKRSLDQLSVEHRDVLELTFYHQCSYTDIAEIVGCPESTVRTRMFYAKKQLQKMLKQEDEPGELKKWLNISK
jgi:RNA polymerase sigma-70 factor (ECF subfamily)